MAATAMVRLPPLPSIRDLVRLYRLRALKELSQNFLLDERLTDKIVRSAGYIKNSYVCEVGPGPGSITRSILRKQPKKLIVVEKDPRFLPTLELLKEASLNSTDMNIEIGDIRSYDLEKGFTGAAKFDWLGSAPPIHLIGNLPFSVSTILMIEWLRDISEQKSAWKYGRSTMTLTFQKEVAERMISPVHGEQRCRLSVMCQMWCEVEHKFTIPGRAFLPKPNVDVSVMHLKPLKKPLVKLPFALVEKVTRNIFHMRQKYCLRGAQNLFPEELRDDLSKKLFVIADVNPKRRSFQINNEEFARLCYAYKALIEDHPEIESYDFRAPNAVAM